MQIVIDIDEHLYKTIKTLGLVVEDGDAVAVSQAIMKGTPLPKGHGDLKDELDLNLFAPSLGTDGYVNDLMARHNIDYVNGDDEDKVRAFALDLIHSCMNVVKTAPTIIEADKEELPIWLGKNCKDCGNEKCKKLGTLPRGYSCALWQAESEVSE